MRKTNSQMEALSARREKAQDDAAREDVRWSITGDECDVRPGIRSSIKDASANVANLPRPQDFLASDPQELPGPVPARTPWKLRTAR
jgi:hypothetical protein